LETNIFDIGVEVFRKSQLAQQDIYITLNILTITHICLVLPARRLILQWHLADRRAVEVESETEVEVVVRQGEAEVVEEVLNTPRLIRLILSLEWP
jgi:hypothetical protein